jgi:hypothetical protein
VGASQQRRGSELNSVLNSVKIIQHVKAKRNQHNGKYEKYDKKQFENEWERVETLRKKRWYI